MALESPEEPDLYSILQVSHTADPSDIRKNYQKLAKEYHPDKLAPDISDEEKARAVDKFCKVAKAYEVLSDRDKRSAYDVNSNSAELTQKWPISDTVDLDEMTFDPKVDSYSLACRCGGSYVISEAEMEVGVDTVCCSTCTLCVKVLYQQAQDEERTE